MKLEIKETVLLDGQDINMLIANMKEKVKILERIRDNKAFDKPWPVDENGKFMVEA